VGYKSSNLDYSGKNYPVKLDHFRFSKCQSKKLANKFLKNITTKIKKTYEKD
jgi:hypothetical protein